METEIDDELRWYKLSLRRAEIGICNSFSTLRDDDIEPILLKGWAAARNYPHNRSRFFGDIDLAVRSENFESASRLLETKPIPNVTIDLHREFRHLETNSWDTLFDRSELIDIDGVGIRVLRPEDHLRVMAVHWLNDGGAYKDRLWDIYYAVENRPDDFDWSLCLDSVESHRRRWVTTTIMLAHKYLGLDVSDVPLTEDENLIPEWIEKALEKEWASEIRLLPLHTCLSDPKLLMQQIRKRFPPNPIQATIETEGRFDDSSRFMVQVSDVLFRALPSMKRITKRIQP